MTTLAGFRPGHVLSARSARYRVCGCSMTESLDENHWGWGAVSPSLDWCGGKHLCQPTLVDQNSICQQNTSLWLVRRWRRPAAMKAGAVESMHRKSKPNQPHGETLRVSKLVSMVSGALDHTPDILKTGTNSSTQPKFCAALQVTKGRRQRKFWAWSGNTKTKSRVTKSGHCFQGQLFSCQVQ